VYVDEALIAWAEGGPGRGHYRVSMHNLANMRKRECTFNYVSAEPAARSCCNLPCNSSELVKRPDPDEPSAFGAKICAWNLAGSLHECYVVLDLEPFYLIKRQQMWQFRMISYGSRID
jgi:hypothetical protein